MSSHSCVRLEQPSSMFGMTPQKTQEHGVVSAAMWTLGTFLVAFNVELQNNTGIQVSTTFTNVLGMLISTLLLGKGLKESKPALIIPWLIVSFWSMYTVQLFDILRIYQVLTRKHIVSKVPWITVGVYAISLAIRCQLTLYVAYVALQQWYNTKLSKEVEESLDK